MNCRPCRRLRRRRCRCCCCCRRCRLRCYCRRRLRWQSSDFRHETHPLAAVATAAPFEKRRRGQQGQSGKWAQPKRRSKPRRLSNTITISLSLSLFLSLYSFTYTLFIFICAYAFIIFNHTCLAASLYSLLTHASTIRTHIRSARAAPRS